MTADEKAAQIAGRYAPRVNALARQIVAEQEAQIPGFADLPDEIRNVEIADTTRHGLRLFLRVVAGEVTSGSDMRLFRDRAAQRMRDGVGLTMLLSAYLVGYRALWRALCAETRPGEEAGLHRLGELLLSAIERTITAAGDAYLHEAELAERGEGRRAVARALLNGPPLPAAEQGVQAVAAHHGVALEPGYRVFALVLGDTSSPQRLRRRLHAVQETLDRFAGEPVLTLFEEAGGHALIPLRHHVDADRMGRRLIRVAEPFHIGAAVAADHSEIPSAAAQAGRIAELARAGRRPSGVYELSDVLLDFHLTAPGAGRDELAGLLDPLDASLITTLEAHFAADFDRRATAEALGVHPNTVDNRLARVVALTGADPRSAHGLLLIGTALTIRRLT